MSKRNTLFAAIALSAATFAQASFAGEKPEMETLKTTDKMIEVTTTDATTAQLITRSADTPAEVLSTVETANLMAVEGPDGRIYYNHIVPISELPDPQLELRVIETYDVQHDGDVFTNKIVQEVE